MGNDCNCKIIIITIKRNRHTSYVQKYSLIMISAVILNANTEEVSEQWHKIRYLVLIEKNKHLHMHTHTIYP